MSQWIERIENHQAQQLRQSLQTLLTQAADHAAIDTQALEALERLRAVNALVTRLFASVDPDIIPIQPLTNMVPHLSSLIGEVQSFLANGNSAHLVNANAHADNLLLQAANIPTTTAAVDIDGMRDAVTSFRRSAGQLIRHLEQEAADHERKIEQQNEAFGKSIEHLRAQLTALAATGQKLDAEIQTQKGRLDAAITEFQSQFSKQQDERQRSFTDSEKARDIANIEAIKKQQSEFTTVSEGHRAQFAAICESARDDWRDVLATTEAAVKNHIASLEDSKKQAETLVHVIGNTGMVGGYQKTANDARNTARFWQVVAVGSFGGLIWFAIKVFSATQSPDFAWSVFAGRVFVAGTFAITAAFAARLADRHEDIERYNRRVELELASIDPYLVGMPKEKQETVKEELARRMFGQKPEPKKHAKVSGTNADVINLLRDMIEALIKRQ